MEPVEWHKCSGGIWCNIFKIDVEHHNIRGFVGQYIIWSGKSESERSTLAVGFGEVTKAILKYREDIAIKAFEHLGVFITWCDIPPGKKKQVHNYLLKTLSPKITTKPEKGGEFEISLPNW